MAGKREGYERKYAGGGTWSGHAQQDFERGNAGQNGKHEELKKVRDEKECGMRHKNNNNGWREKKKSKSS